MIFLADSEGLGQIAHGPLQSARDPKAYFCLVGLCIEMSVMRRCAKSRGLVHNNLRYLKYSFRVGQTLLLLFYTGHYENTPIQKYKKITTKNDNFQIKILIFFIFLLKT